MSWNTTVKDKKRPASKPENPALRLLFSPGADLAIDELRLLSRARLAVGRAVGTAGLSLPLDPRVSRQHAELRPSPAGFVLADCSSTGTFVNGQPIAEQVLNDGDIVRMGDTFLLYRRDIAAPTETVQIDGLLGYSSGVQQLRQTLALVAPSATTVLFLGETGTGKEVAARAMHHLSGRSGPLVALNCSALTASLAESQLFGHIAGSFSGARKDAPGFFRAANGGSLFLDEVGELPPEVQPKLLRALEERAVVPVGATRAVPYDTRIIAATNRPLVQSVAKGEFRSDLYARLAEFVVELPPLRQRREDILVILSAALTPPVPALDPELVHALLQHPWLFNVRELVKVASQLELRAAGADYLTEAMFEFHQRHSLPEAPIASPAAPVMTSPPAAARPDEPATSTGGAIQTEEERMPIPTRAELTALLVRHRGVVADVAREAGRSRKQVYRWVEEQGLQLHLFRR